MKFKLKFKQNLISFLIASTSFAFLTGCSVPNGAYTEYPDDQKLNLVVSSGNNQFGFDGLSGLPTCKNLSQGGSACSVSSTGVWTKRDFNSSNSSETGKEFSLTIEGLNNFENYEFTFKYGAAEVTATGTPGPKVDAPALVSVNCVKAYGPQNEIATFRIEMTPVSGTNIKYGAAIDRYGIYDRALTGFYNSQPFGDSDVYRFNIYDYARYYIGATNGVNAAIVEVYPSTFGGCPVAPPPPFSITSATAGSGVVNLTWDKLASAFSYNVKYGTSPSALNTTIKSYISNLRIEGLTNGTTYYFQVEANNYYGPYGSSTQSSNVMSATPSAPTGPAAFNLTSITPGNAQATLAWASSAGATTYDVKYGTTSGSYTSTISSVTSPYVISGLTNGTTYYFKVAAVNAGGTTNSTNELSVTPAAPAGVPLAPTLLNATASTMAFQIDLDWTDNASDETEYKVERSTDGGTTFTEIANSLPVDTMYYTDTSVSASTTYHYRVRAANAGGDSAYTNVASATTYDGAPDAPTSFTAQTVGPQINLGWSDVAMDETGYEIQKGTASGIYDPTTISQPSGFGTMTYFDTAVTSGNTYYYRIRAVKTGYPASAWSSEVSATIP